jgi:hypothetical protein
VTVLPFDKVLEKEKTRGEQLSDPLGFNGGAKVALNQTHQAIHTYFDFLKKSISAFPSGGTEKWSKKSSP